MGARVPIRWTVLKEVGSLYVRDSAFIKIQVQVLREAILVKPSWKAYCEESALIMAGLLHDKMYNPRSNPSVWEAVHNAADPTKVEVVAMKGRRLLRFSSQLVVRKPCPPGSEPIPVFPAKRASDSETSGSVSKRAKLEALAKVNAPNLTPSTSPTEVISLDDELTFLHKGRLSLEERSAKKGKGKSVSTQGEGSSLDCYSARYMKAPYSFPNGLSIEEEHLWTNCMEAFHAVHPLLSAEEEQKNPSSDPMDAFALSALYMIKVVTCF
ncbi:hypothetical protein LIER_19559 [Lithospermum erythrorhizon]|uniref:Uncharacterized protein n=1 Tax=Lithospermum erythrorhizon TaxID=34254 RepID=A0AAV3QKI3_LITER